MLSFNNLLRKATTSKGTDVPPVGASLGTQSLAVAKHQVSQVAAAAPPIAVDFSAAVTCCPTYKVAERFWEKLPPDSRLIGASLQPASPPLFDPAAHGSLKEYLGKYGQAAKDAFASRIASLRSFAIGHHMPLNVLEALENLAKQTTGELIGSQRQIGLDLLARSSLPSLDRLLGAVQNERWPLDMRKRFVHELCNKMDVCGNGVNNAVDRAARLVEQQENGLSGQVDAFKLEVVEQTAAEMAPAHEFAGSETHWVRTYVAHLADKLGIRVPAEDRQVQYASLDPQVVKELNARVARQATPAALVAHLSAAVRDHVQMALQERARGGSRASSGASGAPALTEQEVHDFTCRMENEIQMIWGLNIGSGQLVNALFIAAIEEDGSEYTFHGRDTLIHCLVRDELERAKMISSSSVALASLPPDGRTLKFDGVKCYCDNGFMPSFMVVQDLARLSPKDFGKHADDIALSVLTTCAAEDLKAVPAVWLSSPRVLRAVLDRADQPPPDVLLQLPLHLIKEAAPQDRAEMLAALLERGVPAGELVRRGFIDKSADQSDLLSVLVLHGQTSTVQELVERHGLSRSRLRSRIEDWHRNPASCALHEGNFALYKLLTRAGWGLSSTRIDLRLDELTFVEHLIDQGNKPVLKMLLDQKIIQEPGAFAARAARAGHAHLLDLLDRAELVKDMDDNFLNPYRQALLHPKLEVIDYILQAVRDVRGNAGLQKILAQRFYLQGAQPYCALEHAIQRNDIKLAGLLLSLGAPLTMERFDARQAAVGRQAMLELIEAHQAMRAGAGRTS